MSEKEAIDVTDEAEQTPRTTVAIEDALGAAEKKLAAGPVKREVTDDERKAVAELMSRHPEISEFTALRFLRARDLDMKKAEKLLTEDLAWRATGIPPPKGDEGAIEPSKVLQSHIPTALATGCWRCIGRSSSGNAIIWVQVALWNPGTYDLDEYRRYVVYFLEQAAKMGEAIVVIFDMSGWKISHALHLRKVACLLDTVQNHYPERLEWALLVRTPMIFSAAWKLIKRMLNAVTAGKVVFTSTWSKDTESEQIRSAGVPNELLPSAYGGEVDGTKIPIPNFPGEPNVESSVSD
jgi:hypothetical protein